MADDIRTYKEGALAMYDDMIGVLVSADILLGTDIRQPVKPGHGPCCTCQDCGRDYDNCVCEHNSLLEQLLRVKERYEVC